jgi:hypothetical protein
MNPNVKAESPKDTSSIPNRIVINNFNMKSSPINYGVLLKLLPLFHKAVGERYRYIHLR